jgi:hypothetical protein
MDFLGMEDGKGLTDEMDMRATLMISNLLKQIETGL